MLIAAVAMALWSSWQCMGLILENKSMGFLSAKSQLISGLRGCVVRKQTSRRERVRDAEQGSDLEGCPDVDDARVRT